MATSNPVLGEKAFQNIRSIDGYGSVMTIDGAVNKVGLLLLIVMLAAYFSWSSVASGTAGLWMVLGGIGGFIVAIVTVFKKEWSPVTAPVYAGLEGLFLGAFSAYMESLYGGIVFEAISLTMLVLFGLLFVYKTRIINVTDNFRLGVFAATFAVAGIYLVSFLLGIFGIHFPYIHDSGPIGIGFSIVVIIIASMNLILDFDFIERGANRALPKYMEWYGAFGLMVTLIWLYIEILKLLAKLRSNR